MNLVVLQEQQTLSLMCVCVKEITRNVPTDLIGSAGRESQFSRIKPSVAHGSPQEARTRNLD